MGTASCRLYSTGVLHDAVIDQIAGLPEAGQQCNRASGGNRQIAKSAGSSMGAID
jgi:hypothetical protein